MRRFSTLTNTSAQVDSAFITDERMVAFDRLCLTVFVLLSCQLSHVVLLGTLCLAFYALDATYHSSMFLQVCHLGLSPEP